MKRTQMFLAPLLSLALLASCGGNMSPDEITFFVNEEESPTIADQTATFRLDWEPSEHKIIINNLKFVGNYETTNITQKGVGEDPRPITIEMTFGSAIDSVEGTFSFTFEDTTAKITGKSEVLIKISKN